MKTTKLFRSSNKKLLDAIMSKDENTFVNCFLTDPNDDVFNQPIECNLPHLNSQKDENEQFLFI